MLFALHPAGCYYNTAIFNSTLREERQYICHLTKSTKPTLCVVTDVLHYFLTLKAGERDDAKAHHTTQWKGDVLHLSRCKPCVQLGLAHLPSHQHRADLCPPIQMQKLPPQQAPSFTHILCMPPLRGCRSDGEKQLQKIWPAGGAQGCDSSENRVGALIISASHHHLSLSSLLSPNTIGGRPLLLFLSYLPSSVHFFFLPNPMAFQCILPPLLTFTSLSGNSQQPLKMRFHR